MIGSITKLWFEKYADSGLEQLMDFCGTYNIVKELQDAVRLAEVCFEKKKSTVRLKIQDDPSTDDVHVVICVSTCEKSRLKVLANYRAYQRRMMHTVSHQASSLIRFSFDMI